MPNRLDEKINYYREYSKFGEDYPWGVSSDRNPKYPYSEYIGFCSICGAKIFRHDLDGQWYLVGGTFPGEGDCGNCIDNHLDRWVKNRALAS